MTDSEIAAPLFNIIILTPDEEVITWLPPDLVKIKEINEVDTVRKIEISYPIEAIERVEYDTPWYNQGNKIFIPEIFGLTNCLYVINTDYKIDYWEENLVTVKAEEVLTELNYQLVGIYSDNPIPINEENLKKWFGRWYKIGTIEKLSENKKTIEELGTVTLMKLLRTIEENTERKFVTEYTYKDNLIYRKLSLVKETTLRQTAGTEYLDLNYNLDSLELEVDEEKTFNAMAPELNINQQVGTESSDYVNANNIRVNADVVSTETAQQVYQNWLDFEVGYREEIPMILKKDEQGNIVPTATWYAPFEKRKGNLYIENNTWTNSKYNFLQPPDTRLVSSEENIYPIPKCGTVTTSETNPYAIYNALANSLLNKLNPLFTLNLKVKDISQILGLGNLGYNIYETLYVKIPGFDYWIPAFITKTTKNPHLPGNDEITIETDVTGTHFREETMILDDNQLIPRGTEKPEHGGVLVTIDKEPLANELLTVNIKLVEAYDRIEESTALIKEWNPKEGDLYYFSKQEIQNLELNLRRDTLADKLESQYLMTDIQGNVYSMPLDWCRAIYCSFIQYYIDTDYPIGNGKWTDTLPVQYSPNYKSILSNKVYLSYFAQAYVGYMNERRDFLKQIGVTLNNPWDHICSSELQAGPTCVANVIANACAYNYMYKSESDILQLFGRSSNEGVDSNEIKTIVIPTLQKLGFDVQIVPLTRENIMKYINVRATAFVAVNAREVGYTTADESMGHAVLLYDWYHVGNNYVVSYMDSNKGVYNPAQINTWNTQSNDMNMDAFIHAGRMKLSNPYGTIFNDGETRDMLVIKATQSQLPPTIVDKRVPANVKDGNNPSIVGYGFKREEIERVWSNILRSYGKDSWNTEFSIKATDGNTYKMNIIWIDSLVMSYLFYYQNNWKSISEYDFIVQTGSNSHANIYFEKKNKKQNISGLGNPVYPSQNAPNAYTLTALLYLLGLVRPPKDILAGTGYTATQQLTFNQWTDILRKFIPDIHTEIMDYNDYNIRKCDRQSRFILAYMEKTEHENDITVTMNQPYYPIIIGNVSQDYVGFYSVYYRNAFTPNNLNGDAWYFKRYAPLPDKPPLTTAGLSEYSNKCLYIELPQTKANTNTTTPPAVSTSNVHSLFVRSDASVTNSTVSTWVANNITDVYVQCRVSTNDTAKLREVINLCSGTGVKVHSWVICFSTDNGFDVSTARQNQVLNFINNTIRIDGVKGICLDYVRYSGSRAGVDSTVITNFVKNTYNSIKAYNNTIELSACVFAEKGGTKTYYGQDYAALSEYLDVELLMAYRYDYNSGRSWLTDVTSYAVTHATKCKLVTVVQTYDKSFNVLSKSELEADIQACISGGSKGWSLFRYGLINSYPSN